MADEEAPLARPSRLGLYAKLGLLLGGPLAVVFSLFSCGVYMGARNSERVVSFERQVLGMEAPAGEDGDDEDGAKKDGAKKDGDKKDGDEEDGDGKKDGEKAEPTPAPAEPTPEPTPTPATPTPAPTAPTPAPATPVASLPVADAAPLEDGALRKALATPRVVKVKVYVDADLAAVRSDWPVYVQSLVTAASRTYQTLFGIELRLQGVAIWEVATAGLDHDAMLEDLLARPRDGGELVLALTARARPDGLELPEAGDGENDGAAVVFAAPGRAEPHYRTMLRAVGIALGATEITDSGDPAFMSSFMSDGPAADGARPTIDAANRKRILERKTLPFTPARSGASEGATDNDTGDAG